MVTPRSRGGHATVELVLALPVLMIFILGLADVGRVMTASASLHRAVSAGASLGIDHTMADSSIKSVVVGEYPGLPTAAVNITRGGDSLIVAASTTVTSFTPLARFVWPSGTVTVNAAAVTRVTP
jgi:Flp pilus assembly protein TadG